MTGNYCMDCGEILVEPVEWAYGYCAECLAIRFERAEEVVYILIEENDEPDD